MHNCHSTRQQQLQKEEITRNRSDNESLSFRSITKIAAIHNPHTTQEITDRKQVVCRVVNLIEIRLDISVSLRSSPIQDLTASAWDSPQTELWLQPIKSLLPLSWLVFRNVFILFASNVKIRKHPIKCATLLDIRHKYAIYHSKFNSSVA